MEEYVPPTNEAEEPIWGMTLDEPSPLREERDGELF